MTFNSDKNRKLLVAKQQIANSILFVLLLSGKRKNTKMGFLGNIALVHYAGWLGGWEIAIIVIIVLLLFGGKKIPELMRGLGKGIKEFKEGVGEDEDKKDNPDKDTNDPKTEK